MLYDAYNRKITEKSGPPAGVLTHWEPSDRDSADISRDLDPELVDSILTAANGGDIRDQSRLAVEVEEKNWDIAQAVQTRRLAVAAIDWTVEPGDDAAGAKSAAADFEDALRSVPWEQQDDALLTFDQAVVFELMGALLPGFACPEIVWGRGGKTILGFSPIEPKHFTFTNSSDPLLVTNAAPSGIALPPAKFLYHRHRARSGDATRGGLIRPLAWLHVFTRLNLADLLRFIERYGGPFLIAKINAEAWERDRNRMKYLVQNFGSDGGAVFTSDVETELLQAANNTGDVYFRLLEYCRDAVTKVVLGQTATSGDAGGLSKGQAQENVRLDLVAGDCRQIDATLDRLARWWTAFNYGTSTPPPRIRHQCEPPEDLKLASEVLVNLNNAGWEAEDRKEISERFGWKLARRPPPEPSPFGPGALPRTPAGAMMPPAPPHTEPASGVPEPGSAGRSRGDAPVSSSADAAAASAEGLALAADAASAAGVGGGAGGGSLPAGVAGAAPQASAIADSALSEFLAGAGLADWFGPLRVAIEAALRGEPDEATFRARLGRLLAAVPDLYDAMDSGAFESALARTIYTATAAAKAEKAEALA